MFVGADLCVCPYPIKIKEKKEKMKEKMKYEAPRTQVRVVFWEGIVAVSSRIAITGPVEYVDYDNTVTEMETGAGKDIIVF
jgi:hypothetical protein